MSKEFKQKKSDSEMDEADAPLSEKIHYTDWFTISLKDHRKLQAHHHDSILAFFRNNGLSKHESKEDFDEMLTVFGF